jgi:hypothetical protein
MHVRYCTTIIIFFICTVVKAQYSQIDYLRMSQDFVYAAKAGGIADAYPDSLYQVDEKTLLQQLDNDDKKKAFFINIYNAYTQIILQKAPEKYKNRNAFFKSKQIPIAHHIISLDLLEHGILRRSKVKWSLGYFNKLFVGKFERMFRVSRVDYRIHFTLNCGAKSCPAIAYYRPEQLNEQLNLATNTYLQSEAIYNSEANVLQLPSLMSWFRGDFGGKRNEIKLCRKLNIIPASAKPQIKYKHYDWNLYLNNYKKINE